MKFLTILLNLFVSLQLLATDDYAVVKEKSIELMNENGLVVQKLRQGTVVKVKMHQTDKHAVDVEFGGRHYFGLARNFRVIESLLDEEVSLLQSVRALKVKAEKLKPSLKDNDKALLLKKNELVRVQRWVEVQRDTAFSRDYFIHKTKKARSMLKALEQKVAVLQLENDNIVKEIEDVEYELVGKSKFLKNLQEKMRPMKAEKSLFEKGFMKVEVMVKNTPVFLNGKIVKYLNKATELKVSVDHQFSDWYVVNKNNHQYYIASADVRVL